MTRGKRSGAKGSALEGAGRGARGKGSGARGRGGQGKTERRGDGETERRRDGETERGGRGEVNDGGGAKSQRMLARRCGRSRATIGRWVKRADWPVRRRGPWSAKEVEAILGWMKLLSPNPADPLAEWREEERERGRVRAPSVSEGKRDRSDPAADGDSDLDPDEFLRHVAVGQKVQAQIRLYVQRAAKVELERRILAGEYRKKADVQREMLAKIHAAKANLLDLPRGLASKLIGLEREAIEQVLEEAVRMILSDFAGRAG